MRQLPTRQIHLDFHTSPNIQNVGERFEEQKFIDTLLEANVNSVTLFAKCHHGYSYHETKVGKQHPNLATDLLRRQYDACKNAGLATPIYLSVGWDELAAEENPDWVAQNEDGEPLRFTTDFLPRWKFLDLGSSYLDYLMAQIEEIISLFPDLDGLFLDIIKKIDNRSPELTKRLRNEGLNPTDPINREFYADKVINDYLSRTSEITFNKKKPVPVFHNQGIIPVGNDFYFKNNSHVEIENLPTAGWGYDHFPFSAAYATGLGKEYLGMTGKFHSSWGELGGYKHPDALRYECAMINAFGGKCSIGDHLHPSGEIDSITYKNIGSAYSEVKDRELYFIDDSSLAAIAVLPKAAIDADMGLNVSSVLGKSEVGISRILLEAQLPFDVVDLCRDWSAYDLLILPDNVRLNKKAITMVQEFLKNGGRLMVSGKSGMYLNRDEFAIDIGATYSGRSENSSDYVSLDASIQPDFVNSPMFMYDRSFCVKSTTAKSLGKITLPYFDQSKDSFSGHLQTPPQLNEDSHDAIIINGAVMYFSHQIGEIYESTGSLSLSRCVQNCIRLFIAEKLQVKTNLPSGARLTLREQKHKERAILHISYAFPQMRGRFRNEPIEIIQELPLLDVSEISLKLSNEIKTAILQPSGLPLCLSVDNDRQVIHLPQFRGFAIVELCYMPSKSTL